LEVIGDAVPEGSRVLPGATFEIDASRGSVELTFYDGGLQVDFARGKKLPRTVRWSS
jgi:hypothetical protein